MAGLEDGDGGWIVLVRAWGRLGLRGTARRHRERVRERIRRVTDLVVISRGGWVDGGVEGDGPTEQHPMISALGPRGYRLGTLNRRIWRPRPSASRSAFLRCNVSIWFCKAAMSLRRSVTSPRR